MSRAFRHGPIALAGGSDCAARFTQRPPRDLGAPIAPAGTIWATRMRRHDQAHHHDSSGDAPKPPPLRGPQPLSRRDDPSAPSTARPHGRRDAPVLSPMTYRPGLAATPGGAAARRPVAHPGDRRCPLPEAAVPQPVPAGGRCAPGTMPIMAATSRARFLRLKESERPGAAWCACSEVCAWIIDRHARWQPLGGWEPPWCVHCASCGRLIRNPGRFGQDCWLHGADGCSELQTFELTIAASRWCAEFLRRSEGRPPSDDAWSVAARQYRKAAS